MRYLESSKKLQHFLILIKVHLLFQLIGESLFNSQLTMEN